MVLAELYCIKLYSDFLLNGIFDIVMYIASSNLLVNKSIILRLYLCPWYIPCILFDALFVESCETKILETIENWTKKFTYLQTKKFVLIDIY